MLLNQHKRRAQRPGPNDAAFDRELRRAFAGDWHEEQPRKRKMKAMTDNPDHEELREAVRLAVLAALDKVAAERGVSKASDAELPALFRALDPIAERMLRAGEKS